MAINKNLLSLGLLRNGKVYANKELAYQGLTQSATNDGVAKLARYLYSETGDTKIIRTLVGFYANAAEMEDAGGGQSYYTILDIEGSAAEVEKLKQEVAKINEIIGSGIDGKTLTEAINEVNDKLGTGFTSTHTVADALEELEEALTNALTISLDVADEPTSGYLKTYILSQGVGTGKTEIGKIDIPKDLVVTSGSLVHGTWSGNTFTEDPDGPDAAIKLVIANQETPVYINTKDLVDYYTAGNGIEIDNANNTIALKLSPHTESFIVVDENGIAIQGIHAAIDDAINKAALEAGNGISIAAGKVNAVAAGYSAPAVKNPISVDKEGIKFASQLDCGFFDDETVVAGNAEDINKIEDPSKADVFINGDEALGALATKKTFKNIEVSDVNASGETYLYATESITVNGMEITGEKGSTNGKVLYSAPVIDIKNLSIANGSTAYNVFEGDQTNQNLDVLNAQYVTVDNPSLTHNVFNVYKPKDNAVINIKDSTFNLTVDNSNILRLANTANATGVTVNFENVEWTYENSLTASDWRWAGLIIYQPYSTDHGISNDFTEMLTWTFNFKNCKYNGVKVTENNFGEHNQVFYLYNVGGDGSIKDPVENGLTLNFA